MNPIRLDDETIFHVARKIEASEARAAYLDQACGDDRDLRRQVDALLSAHDRELHFLTSHPGALDVTLATAVTDPSEVPGVMVGPYRLIEPIGEGGMGTVYVAEQAAPVRRHVALKVIKPGMDSKQVVARFEVERQALAMMDHPNIARVFDGGATPEGRPYFVMELVRGVPITDYCDQHRLSIRDRLELFVLVCRAVQHAHQKGIIHRDLKPSNILVTVVDGVAVPKVIDFGIAKATDPALTDQSIHTGIHQLVGSPLYMSPEQAELSGTDVDTRSDVYSLGVLLYELLTGTTPFEAETLRRAPFDELCRILREEEPPRPSLRLSSLGKTLPAVSARRKADPRRLALEMRAELDWVVLKALEKDPRRRYETAKDFAADVVRYLDDRPVEACPPSSRYRLGKFARRNRAMLTTAGLVALALVVGTAVSAWQAARASAATAVARQREFEARQVVDYLVNDIFTAQVPGKGRGRSTTVGELLDHADQVVGDRFRGQPLVEASVRMALARSFRLLNDCERAHRHASRAAVIRARHLGPDHPETLRSVYEKAESRGWCGWRDPSGYESCAADARRLLAIRRRVLGPPHPETLETESLLAWALLKLDRTDESLALATEAEALALRHLGPDHPTTLFVWDCLAQVVAKRGDADRGEALLRRVASGRELLLGPLDYQTIQAITNLAELLHREGRLDEARTAYLEVLSRLSQTFGITHIRCSGTLNNLFDLLRQQGDSFAMRDSHQGLLRTLLAVPREADQTMRYRRSVMLASFVLDVLLIPDQVPFDADLLARSAQEAVALDGDWDDAWCALAAVYCRTGQLDLAEGAVQASMDRPGREGGDGSDWVILALIHARRGESDQARDWYDRGVAWYEDHDDDWQHYFEPIRAEAAVLLGIDPASGTASRETPGRPADGRGDCG